LLSFGQGFMAQTQLCSNDVGRGWLWLSSFVFDASLKGICLLSSGIRLIIPTLACAQSPESIVKLINEHQVGIINATPQLLELIVKTPGLSNVDLISSGETIGAANFKVFKQFAQQAGTRFINAYGPTESTVNSSFADLTLASKESIGRPVGNTVLYVLNTDMTLAPLGAVGELYIGGDALARGYLNRPELTAGSFIENPFYDADQPNSCQRLYKSGDLVRYLPDGNIEFIGRGDEQVKIRGFRIELGEVEAQLTQLDTVDSALVMAKELAGNQQLVAYLKPRDAVGESAIADYVAATKASVRQVLPEYMVPSIIIVVEQWPLTPNGKLDRKALPAADGSTSLVEYIAPETETEKTIVNQIADIIGIEAAQLSTAENLLNLGFNSILSLRLSQGVATEFEIEAPLLLILESNSIKELALELDLILSIKNPDNAENTVEEEW